MLLIWPKSVSLSLSPPVKREWEYQTPAGTSLCCAFWVESLQVWSLDVGQSRFSPDWQPPWEVSQRACSKVSKHRVWVRISQRNRRAIQYKETPFSSLNGEGQQKSHPKAKPGGQVQKRSANLFTVLQSSKSSCRFWWISDSCSQTGQWMERKLLSPLSVTHRSMARCNWRENLLLETGILWEPRNEA